MAFLDGLTAVEQRAMLGDALVQLGREYPQVVVLCPDVSRSTGAGKFRDAFPERYFSTGVSEQNTIGMASGLSKEGWLPIVVGFAMFVIGKPWEPLRNSIAYPGNNVKIIGTHAGINVGADGVTAQAIEDIALTRAIPGMTVLVPTDGNQILPVLRAAIAKDGPVYVRLERAAIPLITSSDMPFLIGRSVMLREGSHATVIAIGSMVAEALVAAHQLETDGISARVISMVSIKPLDVEAVLQAARDTQGIVTAEDHNCYGGLGSAVAEVLAQAALGPLEQVALRDTFGESGEAPELRAKYHLSADAIAQAVRTVIARRATMEGMRA